MLTVVTLTMGMIVAIGMAGFTFNNLLFQRAHAECQADALAVQLAGDINQGDRVGQMNELESSSRELIYVSRQQIKRCSEDEEFDFLSPLCQQLVAEARGGHKLLEMERRNLARHIEKDIHRAALDHNRAAAGHKAFSIPWLQIAEPQIVRIDVGYVDNIESNVRSLASIDELADFDDRRGYIDHLTKLYKGNINASLPDIDSDLCFKLSSLPAYVEQTCSPARNINSEVFIPMTTAFNNGYPVLAKLDQIPNAVQVTCSLGTTLHLRDKMEADLYLLSSGVTNGAIAGGE
jgi:hypothetical protein